MFITQACCSSWHTALMLCRSAWFRRFHHQLANQRTQMHIVHTPKAVQAHGAFAVYQHQAGRTLHAVGLHGQRYVAAHTGLVYTYRKANAVFVHKRFERINTHHRMVLKHRVQANHRHVRLGESLSDLCRLR